MDKEDLLLGALMITCYVLAGLLLLDILELIELFTIKN